MVVVVVVAPRPGRFRTVVLAVLVLVVLGVLMPRADVLVGVVVVGLRNVVG